MFALALAGCLQQPPTPTEPADGTALVQPQPGRPMFQFLNCTVIGMELEVPKELVRGVIPPAFEPYGAAPYLVGLRVVEWSCPRTVSNESVYGPTSEFFTFAFAYPKNHSWAERGYINWYLLDYATSSQALASHLAALGVPAQAGEVSLSLQDLPAGGQLGQGRAVTQNFTAEFRYRTGDDTPQAGGGLYQLWYGTTTFRRSFFQNDGHVESIVPVGELILQGSTRLGAIYNSPLAVWQGGSHDDDSWVWTFDEQEFRHGG